MTRRTFLKSLSVAGAGVAAGLSILPTCKVVPPPQDFVVRPNAAYYTAPLRGVRFGADPHPARYRICADGSYERVYPFIKIPIWRQSPTQFRLIDGEWRRAEWA